MTILPCAIPGPLLIEPQVFDDERGFFLESWSADRFAAAGLPSAFVQDNHSHSRRGVLRGLHFQNPGAQGKLVRVSRGAIWDVAVDLRRASPCFGQWVGVELSADNHRQLWVPEGFAHGFLSLADDTDVLYKCTAPYAPEHEQTLIWNDPALAIDWPLEGVAPLLSPRDQAGLRLAEARVFA